MKRIIEASRYVVVLPAVGALVGALVLIVIGLWEIGEAIYKLARLDVELKASIVSVLTAVDTLLLATVLLVIGYGLYELFVDESVELPAWLQIHSLDDLKGKLIGVVVAVIAVVFLGELVEGKDPEGVMLFGVGAGALVLALAAFSYATRASGKPGKDGASDSASDSTSASK